MHSNSGKINLYRILIKTMKPEIAIDVAIFRKKNRKEELLLGKRKGEVAFGFWNFPGGHIEAEEGLIETAQREVKEELGETIQVKVTSEIVGVTYNVLAPKFVPHLVIILRGEYEGGEPTVASPNEYDEWEWFEIACLSKRVDIFDEVKQVLLNRQSGQIRMGAITEAK